METPHPHRWRALAVLGTAELLGMSLWFTANAVAPALRALWDLDAARVGWLTTAVQLGFVAGTATAAVLNLADVVPGRWYFTISTVLAAAANAAVAVAPGFSTVLALRFGTGFFLAGVYPPAMKMIATWFRSGRGLAIGAVVGALTIGKATPYLVRAFEATDHRVVVLAASAAALGAALLVAVGYREGPHPFGQRPFSWRLTGAILRHRPTRLAIAGYLGHMWELYAMWTWIPAFLAASLAVSGGPAGGAGTARLAELLAFGTIAAGGLGCLWGGWQADRIGREPVVNLAMAISGGCCIAVGFAFGSSAWVLAPLTWIWGFFVVADSAQFSAVVTEVAPDHAVGTALTLQTSSGFLLTMVTIQMVPELVEAVGWRWGFAALALGPAAGIAAIRRLQGMKPAGDGPEG